jgi:hypothetical protein
VNLTWPIQDQEHRVFGPPVVSGRCGVVDHPVKVSKRGIEVQGFEQPFAVGQRLPCATTEKRRSSGSDIPSKDEPGEAGLLHDEGPLCSSPAPPCRGTTSPG